MLLFDILLTFCNITIIVYILFNYNYFSIFFPFQKFLYLDNNLYAHLSYFLL